MTEQGKEFLCSYQFDGAEWSITIHAASEQEASRRMHAIGMTGRVDGELVADIPAYALTVIRQQSIELATLRARVEKAEWERDDAVATVRLLQQQLKFQDDRLAEAVETNV